METVLPKRQRQTWGERLRAVRNRNGMTPAQMGQAMGYKGKAASRETIVRRFELGMRKLPEGYRRLLKMWDAYGIPRDWYE